MGMSSDASKAWMEAFGAACAVADAATEKGGHVTNMSLIGAEYRNALEKDSGNLGVNPYFLTHQVDELDEPGHSPKTRSYYKWRKAKQIGGKVFSGLGSVISIGTQANVFGAARHGRAEASTLTHLYRFRALARQVKGSQYLTHLIDTMIRAKGIKAASRGGQLAGDLIPTLAPGVGTIVKWGSAKAGKMAMKQMSAVVSFTAIELHWRAYQEIKLTRTFGGGSGPATRMLCELMNSPVLDKVRDGTSIETYIREPMGHLVFREKLLLI